MADDWFDKIMQETDWDAANAAFQQYKKDSDFLNANRAQLRLDYPDKWVAVFREELVGVADTLREVLQETQEYHVDSYRVALAYLPQEPIRMILYGGKDMGARA